MSATPAECGCGCGGTTRGGRYLPGHDAKHVAWLVAMVRAGNTAPAEALAVFDGRSPALYNKLVARLRKVGYTYDANTRTWAKP